MTSVTPRSESPYAAVTASFLGWMLDAFDFFLVVMTLTAIAKDFGKTDADMAIVLTVTLAMRPVGALVFGLLADRYGRKGPLMASVVFFSVCSMLSGLAPDFRTFLIIRTLFGIGMGGEWGVGASLAMEKAPPKRRGVLSGLLQEGYACGYLLAAISYFAIFPIWGWRPLFLLGGLPALLALYIRSRVSESEVWRAHRHHDWSSLGRSIGSHWKLFLYLAVLMTAMSAVAHGTQDMYPTLLQRDWGFAPRGRAALTAFSMVGAIVGGLTFGHISDRFGRRRAIVVALVLGIMVIPLWAFAPNLPLLVAGAFLMQFMVQGAWGVIPAHITELVPNSVRGFLPGVAYQVGVALSSAVAYVETVFAARTTYAMAMSLTAVTVFSLAALAARAGPERHGEAWTS
jgi:SHS family lactate transporter-like MFS transporter